MNNVRKFLREGDVVQFDIFTHKPHVTLLIRKGTTITERLLSSLENFDYDFQKMNIVVSRNGEIVSNDPQEVKAPPKPEPAPVKAEPRDKTAVNFSEKLKNDAVNAAKHLFSDGVTTKELNSTSAELSHDITDTVLSAGANANICIQDLRVTDEYTYQHSVDVGVLAAQLAKRLGWVKEKVDMTAQSGILHDIGKKHVPLEILNKPGRLTDEEFAVMKLHPVYAYKELSVIREMANEVKLGAFEHHEKMNGKGYPRGLSGNQISEIAQVLAIADVYDALTSKRAYKEGMSSARAVGIMSEMMDSFNPKFFAVFLNCITLYPVGTRVICSDGFSYKVESHNVGHPTRPVLLNEFNGRRIDLCENREISIFGEDCEEIRNKLNLNK
ncbi:MAG: HD-GYP domain-containing protein [Lachnospiraceae bacterium]|nr:HD-GYP domain-containing protein [Lachnospiraceae bacterium]